MRRNFPVEDLARDERFVRVTMQDRMADPRGPRQPNASAPAKDRRLNPAKPGSEDMARGLMHGIFVGELQALEGAGRTCFDFDTGPGRDDVPFALKLDMARQCWDEARHCEISVKLSEWMGTEIGEFSENTFLYEAACSPDPVKRLCGVNRALEGLAIDVFTQMRDFATLAGDPVLYFSEDWMLADEVTHVRMGSTWLRALTADDPERRAKALEFQSVVDKLFSSGGFRSDSARSPVQLARRFRELAGFSEEEIDHIADVSMAALEEAEAARRRAAERRAAQV